MQNVNNVKIVKIVKRENEKNEKNAQDKAKVVVKVVTVNDAYIILEFSVYVIQRSNQY